MCFPMLFDALDSAMSVHRNHTRPPRSNDLVDMLVEQGHGSRRGDMPSLLLHIYRGVGRRTLVGL